MWDRGTRLPTLALVAVRHCRCHRHCPGGRALSRQVTVFGPRSTKPLCQNIIESAYTLSLAQSVYPSLERGSSRVCPDASCRVGRYQNQSHQIRQYGTRSDYSRQPKLDAVYRSDSSSIRSLFIGPHFSTTAPLLLAYYHRRG